jgi:DNA-binding LacI/PurR family transcriptional regulator
VSERTRPITSLDVARLAGVSQPTVSLVMSGQAEKARVSADTKRRVLAAAADLQYVPNRLAQSLRNRSTRAITVVLPGLQNPFFSEVVSAVQIRAEAEGYTLNVMVANSDEAERRVLAYLAGGSVDAVLLAASTGPVAGLLRKLVSNGVVCVVLQGESLDPAIPTIRVDLEAGGYLATRHLISLGHRHIAHVTEPSFIFGEKVAGYRRALAEAGISFRKNQIFLGENNMAGGATAVRKLLDSSKTLPTAIFAQNDLMAVGAIRVLQERGLQIPKDMALVGFDGTALGCFTTPSLTTVSHKKNAVAVEVLFSLLKGDGEAVASQTVPMNLTVRESCGGQSQLRQHCQGEQ